MVEKEKKRICQRKEFPRHEINQYFGRGKNDVNRTREFSMNMHKNRLTIDQTCGFTILKSL